MSDTWEHPIFARAKALPEHLRKLFPTNEEEARSWKATRVPYQLSAHLLVVAQTRIECAWAAYIGAMGQQDYGVDNHFAYKYVAMVGDKLPEEIARVIFPQFAEVPYAP